jgi:hypothetical protein
MVPNQVIVYDYFHYKEPKERYPRYSVSTLGNPERHHYFMDMERFVQFIVRNNTIIDENTLFVRLGPWEGYRALPLSVFKQVTHPLFLGIPEIKRVHFLMNQSVNELCNYMLDLYSCDLCYCTYHEEVGLEIRKDAEISTLVSQAIWCRAGRSVDQLEDENIRNWIIRGKAGRLFLERLGKCDKMDPCACKVFASSC